MKGLHIAILLIFSQLASAFDFPQASDMWLRAAPPNAKMLAAYVKVENHSTEDLKIVGVYAPDFALAEIHKTVEIDGLLRMREQKDLPLLSDSKVLMQPGGIHIMLMMPQVKINVGDEIRICLIYQNQAGEEHIQHLDFPVKKQ